MGVAISPTDYLQHHFDPISKHIDSFGGPHLLVGVIASGGQPHIYLTGNCTDNLQKEICEALADKLHEIANKTTPSTPKLIV